MFPQTVDCFADPEQGATRRAFLVEALRNTDARIQDDLTVHPAFLYAALLWSPVQSQAHQRITEDGEPAFNAWQKAGGDILDRQARHVVIPRRYTVVVREIWDLQYRLLNSRGVRAPRLLNHPRFRAAYDFLCLRARVGDVEAEHCTWWTEYQDSDTAKQQLKRLQRLLKPSRHSTRTPADRDDDDGMFDDLDSGEAAWEIDEDERPAVRGGRRRRHARPLT